jgi:outer membrane murein-binding lipoprotein Lpp
MLPLVEGTVGVEKTLVFSASRLRGGETVHPVSGAELVNATGMKLPAGPLTVYEGGTYAGDALIEFFPPGERRIVSWGEDLAVTGRAATALSRPLTAVTVSGGLMTINRKQNHERTYAIRNGSTEEKTVVVEHPITGGANLAEPASPEERTGEVYRFKRVLPPGGELSLTVREESPLSERISLTQLRLESFISYASSQEIPPPVRAALMRAVELRQEVDQAQTRLRDLDSRRDRLAAEQDRIRRNLEAAGTQSPQGQDYLRRMSALDGELDVLMAAREEEEAVAKRAQAVYDNYLASLSL